MVGGFHKPSETTAAMLQQTLEKRRPMLTSSNIDRASRIHSRPHKTAQQVVGKAETHECSSCSFSSSRRPVRLAKSSSSRDETRITTSQRPTIDALTRLPGRLFGRRRLWAAGGATKRRSLHLHLGKTGTGSRTRSDLGATGPTTSHRTCPKAMIVSKLQSSIVPSQAYGSRITWKFGWLVGGWKMLAAGQTRRAGSIPSPTHQTHQRICQAQTPIHTRCASGGSSCRSSREIPFGSKRRKS
ncbi:hypothetical protein IWZ00DRAFT_227940 [Phyllosticta capitalensis]